ncbi:NAD kinase [Alphaproteobacteria bacterium SO-S41]|nr:NAD kinase [Alphaproteobacteria bacterium SO-S41]
MSDIPRIAFTASSGPDAQAGLALLRGMYPEVPEAEAEIVVALGGDGFMLEVLHRHLGSKLPIYGMNLGSVGFLMNEFRPVGLLERLSSAERAVIHPLRMRATCADGSRHGAIAINEVSLLRETRQAAKIRIWIDGQARMEELICDGVLVSSPAGSTAYNLSAHGPILPIDAALLALTPISAFRPRRWRGALLPHKAQVRFEVLEAAKRPVSAVADHAEVRDVIQVDVVEDRSISLSMLFDAGRNLNERILTEQFVD